MKPVGGYNRRFELCTGSWIINYTPLTLVVWVRVHVCECVCECLCLCVCVPCVCVFCVCSRSRSVSQNVEACRVSRQFVGEWSLCFANGSNFNRNSFFCEMRILWWKALVPWQLPQHHPSLNLVLLNSITRFSRGEVHTRDSWMGSAIDASVPWNPHLDFLFTCFGFIIVLVTSKI